MAGRGSRGSGAAGPRVGGWRGWRVLVTAVAVALAALHVARPELKVDGISLGLLAVALIPWLGSVLESIELPGWVRIQYRQLQADVNEAKGAAASAEQKAEVAIAGAGLRAREERAAAQRSPEEQRAAALRSPDVRLRELARRYDELRATLPGGAARSDAMTQVVREMLELAPRTVAFDWRAALADEDQGIRIAAYALLYITPDPAAAGELARALTTREQAAFGQFWAIQALGRALGAAGTPDPAVLAELRAFQERLPPGTDRSYELSRILGSPSGTPAGDAARSSR
jgi:hypothetical protein